MDLLGTKRIKGAFAFDQYVFLNKGSQAGIDMNALQYLTNFSQIQRFAGGKIGLFVNFTKSQTGNSTEPILGHYLQQECTVVWHNYTVNFQHRPLIHVFCGLRKGQV